MKPLKKFFLWVSFITACALTLSQNVVAGGGVVYYTDLEMQPLELVGVDPIIVSPIDSLPDFYIAHVDRVRDDSNPYQTFYRYTVTIENGGGFCKGGAGPILVRGTFLHVDDQGQYTNRSDIHVDPPAHWSGEVTVTFWDGVSDRDNANWWHSVIRVDVDDQYIESDESNNVWQCNYHSCDSE